MQKISQQKAEVHPQNQHFTFAQASKSVKNYTQLHQLTTLRFIAAFMIVIHHSVSILGIQNVDVNLGQGVTFFFVLSGFILTYVYPSLETFTEVKNFWRARVARIWPAYLVCFAIGFFLVHYVWDTKIAIANLLMVQSWLPLSSYYFSYNSVSWSVSTEAFFYLMFPILLYKWDRNWKVKFFIAGAVLISLLFVSNYLQLPDYGSPVVGSDGLLITQHGLIYINPISRIFEFVLGMVIATLWRNKNWFSKTAYATIYEAAAVLLCFTTVYFGNDIARLSHPLGSTTVLWLVHSGSLFSFGLLIYVMAQGRGWISSFLSTPFFVLLGEISYSMYLFHQILLVFYSKYIPSFSPIPNIIIFLVFVFILIISSYLLWVCIEIPGRQFLLGRGNTRRASTMKESLHDHRPASKKTAIAIMTLVCFSITLYLLASRPLALAKVDWQSAEKLTPDNMRIYIGARFQDAIKLRGLRCERNKSDLILSLAWEKTGLRDDRLTNAIHLINPVGDVLAQADFMQPEDVPKLKLGDIWLDSVTLSLKSIKNGGTSFAIGVYDKSGSLFTIHHVNTDWGGRRLVVDLEKCLNMQSP